MNGLEALQGIDVILLYRRLSKATQEAAWKMAFQTQHENTLSRDSESVPTKDGNIQNMNPVSYDFSATSIVAVGDPHVKEMKHALIDGEVIELWEINRSEKGTAEPDKDKFAATYYRGKVSEFGTNPGSEGAVELSMSFAIDGVGQDGFATLTDDQAKVVQYVFEDTTKRTANP